MLDQKASFFLEHGKLEHGKPVTIMGISKNSVFVGLVHRHHMVPMCTPRLLREATIVRAKPYNNSIRMKTPGAISVMFAGSLLVGRVRSTVASDSSLVKKGTPHDDVDFDSCTRTLFSV